MPSEPTPAARLREAAALLREAAAKVHAGPWVAHRSYGRFGYVATMPEPGFELGQGVVGEVPAETADWVALASPAIAEHQAALLDEAAGWHERAGQFDYPTPAWIAAALAIANQIRASVAHNQEMPR